MGKAELKIEIDQTLLAEARALELDLSEITAEGVRRALMEKRAGAIDAADASAWASENAEALERHRARIKAFGVFGEDLRNW